jgi:hypothetical protein
MRGSHFFHFAEQALQLYLRSGVAQTLLLFAHQSNLPPRNYYTLGGMESPSLCGSATYLLTKVPQSPSSSRITTVLARMNCPKCGKGNVTGAAKCEFCDAEMPLSLNQPEAVCPPSLSVPGDPSSHELMAEQPSLPTS